MSHRDELAAGIADEEARLAKLKTELVESESCLAKLREELDALPPEKIVVVSCSISGPPAVPPPKIAKIPLFRSLFRGREDLFPKYWENAEKSKHGYSPACANEWSAGLCDKRNVKCGQCPNRSFIPLSDQIILDHFNGRDTIGVYPLLVDETCWFIAADFDKASWHDDVAAFVETCRGVGVEPSVERSRSGNGAHVWFFFTAPVAASVARRMCCYFITQTMERRHQLSMESYDRLFPNQDTMPRGGFGNLIALPFQDKARRRGNSVFIDDALKPWPDQWVFLAGVRRLTPDLVETLAREAARRGQVVNLRTADPADGDDKVPWKRPPSRRLSAPIIVGPLPSEVHAVLSQRLFVGKAGLPTALINRVRQLAAFQNPEFIKKERMRLSTRGTPRVISCGEDLVEHMSIPRGCLPDLERMLSEHKVGLRIDDKRHEGEPLDVDFGGQLTPVQELAGRALLRNDTGVFVAPPGIGKTVLGTYLIAQRRRNTLVLVHRQHLLDQWAAQLSMFLGIDEKEIGRIGGGKRKPNGRLDVAMLQSLVRNGVVDDRVPGYGHVIVDECHHLPAFSFERVLNEVRARFIVGLTATPRRRDGHHPITEMQLGPVRFSIDPKNQAARPPFELMLHVRDTGLPASDLSDAAGIQALYTALSNHQDRNELICNDVIHALEEKRSPILLTERRDHLEYFAGRLRSLTRHLVVLHGGMKLKERREVLARLASIPDGEERLLIATGRYIGEGFDDARLDTLFLALPISFRGTLVQYSGRLHRLHPGKTDVRIYDYVDRNVPMLVKMFAKRLGTYRAIGYARDEAPLGFVPPPEDPIVERDEDAIRHFDEVE